MYYNMVKTIFASGKLFTPLRPIFFNALFDFCQVYTHIIYFPYICYIIFIFYFFN